MRLPKKLSGTGSHRGFAFVDFLTKQDAKVLNRLLILFILLYSVEGMYNSHFELSQVCSQ